MTLKTSFKKAFACFSACVIMFYSLISAPLFGVHAASIDGAIDAIGDFLHRAADLAVSKVLEPLGPVGDLIGITIMSLADQPINAMKNDDAVVENVQFDLGATVGITCPVHIGSSSDNSMLTTFTIPNITVSKSLGILHDVDYMPRVRIARISGDTVCDVYALLQPYNDGTWPDGDYITISSSTVGSNQTTQFNFNWTFRNGDAVVSRPFRILFTFEYGDGSVQSRLSDSYSASYYHIRLDFSQPYVQTYTPYDHFNPYRNDVTFYETYLTDQGVISPVGNLPNTTYRFPSYKDTYITYNTSYDYLENYSYPYVVENYPVYQELPPPSSFLPPEETTSPGSGIIIIDPFTLPPEWVQSDVVELETDHYTIPYTDLVRNPYDYLVYGVTAPPPPVTPADDAKKALQTKTTTTKATRSGDPIKDLNDTDPAMYQALLDYSSLLQDILDRSGVLPYWAILMAAGALFLII